MHSRRTRTTTATAGDVLQLVRHCTANTRSDLGAATGLGRSAISQRVEALLDAGLVVETASSASTGGRPPVLLAFEGGRGVVLAADLGATHATLAVADLHGEVLAETVADVAISDGPDLVLGWVLDRFDDLLAEASRRPDDVRGVGVGLPGPVEYAAGRAVYPPIMPGWDGVAVPDVVHDRFDAPVLVDNDVNIIALGEYWTHWRDRVDDLLVVKVGTGIGLGIIIDGAVHRGAQGGAGDLGHVRVGGADHVQCRCGNVGCVEAVAGGAALARNLTALGTPAASARDVVELVRAGDSQAARLVRDAGRAVGEVLAAMVNVFNPPAIVVNGTLAEADQLLLAGIREVVYQRSTALSTRHLELIHGRLGDHAGLTGAIVMVVEHLLSPDQVDRSLAAT